MPTETLKSSRPAVLRSEALPIVVAAKSDRAEWDAFVASQPAAAGYHEWAWREVFERSFGHKYSYLMARDEDGQVQGVLPLVEMRGLLFGRSMTSMPFVNYGGVLTGSDRVARALVDAASRIAGERGCRHVELRHIGRRFEHLPVKQHKVTMRLPLGHGMWEILDRKVRNQIRKAEKSGLTVERGGANLVPFFYTVFARNMRDLGTPVYAQRFFDEVLRAFPDRVNIVAVRLNDQPVAAALTYRTRTMVEVPWASSIRDYNSLCPNHLMYWSIIEHAVDHGCDVLDFGRSTPNEGTFKFKEQWGASPVPLHWEYSLVGGGDVPDQTNKNPKYQRAIETWKRLPLGLANVIGPYLVRSIP